MKARSAFSLMAVSALWLGGCAAGPDTAGPGSAATTRAVAAPSTSTTTSSPSTTAAPSAPPTVSLSPALVAAINDLSAKSAGVSRLDPARTQVQTGNTTLTDARNAITAMRGAAYGATKNCGVVLGQLGIVRARTATANGAANAAEAVLAGRRGEIAALAQAATTVEQQVAAAGQSLAGLPNVQAAVTSARTEVTTETDNTNKVGDAVAAVRTNAAQLLANGNDIATKSAC